MKSLEQSANLLFNWFKNNQMKGNENDCHALISTDETDQVYIGVSHVTNSKCEKLLGIIIDCQLSFDNDMENICEKTGEKLNAFTRVVQPMNTKKELNYERFFFATI